MCSKVQGLRASCMCVHLLVCAVKHVMAKQVSPPWTCLCNVVTEDNPVFCLQNPIHSSLAVFWLLWSCNNNFSALTVLAAGLKAITAGYFVAGKFVCFNNEWFGFKVG